MFLVQYLLARLRQASDVVQHTISNRRVLLLRDGRFCQAALAENRVSKENILARIRAADAGSIEYVGAVVLETTSDMSELSGGVDPRVLAGVDIIDEPRG